MEEDGEGCEREELEEETVVEGTEKDIGKDGEEVAAGAVEGAVEEQGVEEEEGREVVEGSDRERPAVLADAGKERDRE